MVYFVSDHAGFKLKNRLIQTLRADDIMVEDFSPVLDLDDDYPFRGRDLARKLALEDSAFGVAICGSGQGICMALNRFSWIRAGLAREAEEVKLLRQHNRANVLCLSGSNTNVELALDLIKVFLETSPSTDERHIRRVGELSSLII